MGPKRKRDTWPQYMVFSGVQTGVDTTTVITVPLPINPYDQGGEILEILRIKAELGATISMPPGTAGLAINVGLSTKSTGMVVTSRTAAGPYFNADPFTFWTHQWAELGATTSGGGGDLEVADDDITNGGHGHPVVTPNMYLTIASASSNKANVVRMRVWYRKRKMPLQEYLGLFQSQQSAT